MKNRILCGLLSIGLCLSLSTPALAATEGHFADVPSSHWAHAQITDAVKSGIVTGYQDGTFKPAASVTKNQFAVMLSRAFFPDDIKKNQANADGQAWYWANLKALADRGLLYGTVLADESNWASRGGVSITRYEMAQLMNSILGAFGKTATAAQKSAAQNAISDWRFISPDYQDAVATCYALGVLNGQSDGSFGGANPMNRAQGCVVIGRLKAFIEDGTTSAPTTEPENPSETTKPENPGTTEEPGTSTGAAAGTLANGKPITVDNVLEIFDEIRKDHPEGSIYMPVGQTYNSRAVPKYTGGRECIGWAMMCSDLIFGKGNVNPARELTDHSKIRPGDIICIYDDESNAKDPTHTTIATSELQACDPWNDPDGMAVTVTESGPTYVVGWTERSDGTPYHIMSSCETAANEDACHWVIYTRYPD